MRSKIFRGARRCVFLDFLSRLNLSACYLPLRSDLTLARAWLLFFSVSPFPRVSLASLFSLALPVSLSFPVLNIPSFPLPLLVSFSYELPSISLCSLHFSLAPLLFLHVRYLTKGARARLIPRNVADTITAYE